MTSPSDLPIVAVAAFFLGASPTQADSDTVVVSPHKRFRIESHRIGSEDGFVSRLHFRHARYPPAIFTRTSGNLWRPLFYISPDERWILQIQKTGSGESQGLLYRIDPGGRLRCVEAHLEERAMVCVKKRLKDYYHVGIAFGAWDRRAGALRFQISGTSNVEPGSGVREWLDLRLRDGALLRTRKSQLPVRDDAVD